MFQFHLNNNGLEIQKSSIELSKGLDTRAKVNKFWPLHLYLITITIKITITINIGFLRYWSLHVLPLSYRRTKIATVILSNEETFDSTNLQPTPHPAKETQQKARNLHSQNPSWNATQVIKQIARMTVAYNAMITLHTVLREQWFCFDLHSCE